VTGDATPEVASGDALGGGRAAIRSNDAAKRDAMTVFSVMWALASVWHILATPSNASEGSQLVLTLGVLLAIVFPGTPLGLSVLALGGLATLWSEAPLLGNHWLLAGFVNVAILVVAVAGLIRGDRGDRLRFAGRLVPTLRLCLLSFYAFASFAKLNSAFFDRDVSCGGVYFRESTSSVHASFLQLGGNGIVEWMAIYGTSAVELSIPILLVWRRTRVVAVALALAFHGILAIDRHHLFFDFSSVLAALFVLFLPPSSMVPIVDTLRRAGAELARAGERVPLAARAFAGILPASVALLVATRTATIDALQEIGWWSWQIMSLTVVIVVVRHVWRARPVADPGAFSLRPIALAVIPALVVVNGLSPYLELKTGYGWNMYANLRTVDGDSNHYIVRATLPLSDQQDELVEVVTSSDPGLQAYADQGFGLPWQNLRAYTADHPDASLTYRRGGVEVVVERVGDVPDLATAPPAWRLKLQPFRSSDLSSPERCQTSFLPAG